MSEKIDEAFVDGIVNVSHVNGVFRITFGQQEAEGEIRSVVKLMVPGNQIATVMQALSSAVTDIAEKIKSKEEEASKEKKAAKK